MNPEIIFKSSARVVGAGTLSYILALSLCVLPNLSVSAVASQVKKTEKSAQENSDKSDKKDDKSDKKDDKSDKKDDKSDKKDAKVSDKAKDTTPPKPEPVIENVVNVSAEELVDKPHDYMGKNVKFTAPFFAFSNLALDYKPALRPAKTHISLLVSRSKKNKLPLSELKLAMMTPAEKDPETQLLAGLKEGDTLEITGKVFSTALDDPWVDILRLKKIGGSTDDKKADASSKEKKNDTKSTDAKGDKANGSKNDGDSKTPEKH